MFPEGVEVLSGTAEMCESNYALVGTFRRNCQIKLPGSLK